jgi:hypothetical protein
MKLVNLKTYDIYLIVGFNSEARCVISFFGFYLANNGHELSDDNLSSY